MSCCCNPLGTAGGGSAPPVGVAPGVPTNVIYNEAGAYAGAAGVNVVAAGTALMASYFAQVGSTAGAGALRGNANQVMAAVRGAGAYDVWFGYINGTDSVVFGDAVRANGVYLDTQTGTGIYLRENAVIRYAFNPTGLVFLNSGAPSAPADGVMLGANPADALTAVTPNSTVTTVAPEGTTAVPVYFTAYRLGPVDLTTDLETEIGSIALATLSQGLVGGQSFYVEYTVFAQGILEDEELYCATYIASLWVHFDAVGPTYTLGELNITIVNQASDVDVPLADEAGIDVDIVGGLLSLFATRNATLADTTKVWSLANVSKSA